MPSRAPDTPLLRPGVLSGVPVIVAGPPGAAGELAQAVAEACAGLGALVAALAPGASGDDGVAAPVQVPEGDGVPVLVWDGDAAFRAAGAPPSVASVRAALDGGWDAIRAVAAGALIPGGRGGKVVLLAPRGAGAHAEAARSGTENMARTLSIEWARHGIRLCAVLPGERTAPARVAALAAYIASPAGDYFSGCAFSLDVVEL